MIFLKRLLISVLPLCACLLLASCGKKSEGGGSTAADMSVKSSVSTENMDFEFSGRDTTYDYDENEVVTVDENEKSIKITSEGSYVVTGAHESITVEAGKNDKVRIILKNAEISNPSGPAIYIKSADKVFLTVCEGTASTLSDGTEYSDEYTADNADAAVFSRADLTINGLGTLNIKGNFKCGVASKDDLIICGLTLVAESAGHSLEGKDCVKIKDAALCLTAGADGIHSDNSEDSDKGFVYVASGNIEIAAENDGIQAETVLKIENGTFKITTADGAGEVKTEAAPQMPDFSGNGSGSTSADEESRKALKAEKLVTVSGGSLEIDSADDAVHSNGDIEIGGGFFEIFADDDGFHADEKLIISAGEITIEKSYEGLEGQTVNVTGGSIDITASDDGINAASPSDSTESTTRPGPGMGGGMDNDSSASVNIGGGYIVINASGDGIDSNGSVYMTGGTVLVSGPTDNGNAAFDYGGEAYISGGIAVFCGTPGMAQGFSENSNQASFMYSLQSSADAGKSVAVTDTAGNVIAAFMPAKQYSHVVISAPELEKGGSYKLLIGGTPSAGDKNGFAANGTVSGAETEEEITLTAVSTSFGSNGMGGGMQGGGMQGGGIGGRGDGFNMKPGQNGDFDPTGGEEPPEKPDGDGGTPPEIPQGGFGEKQKEKA